MTTEAVREGSTDVPMKPYFRPVPEHVYLAGPIAKNDWRHSIVTGLRGESALRQGEDWDDWPIMERAIFGDHHYVGPYFLSCDHGCFHGQATHGCGETNGCTPGVPCGPESAIPAEALWECEGELRRDYVARQCVAAISRCSVIFAWIDRPDCYGTLVELGYAARLNDERNAWLPKIFMAGPGMTDEHWLLSKLGIVRIKEEYTTTPEATLQMVLNDFPFVRREIDYDLYIHSDDWRARAKAAKERAGWRCQVCNTPGSYSTLACHHRTYDRLGHELPDDLVVLCKDCHALFHRNGRVVSDEKRQCKATTVTGDRCRRWALSGSDYCSTHQGSNNGS